MNWPKILSELRFPLRRPRWLLLSLAYTGLLYAASSRAGLVDIGNPFWILTAGSAVLLSPIYHAVLIPWMVAARSAQAGDGEAPRVDVEKTFPRLIIGELMVNALVIAGAFVFLLPGVYLGVRLAFYKQAILIDDKPPMAAMRESFRRTANWRLAFVLFGALAVFYGVATGVNLLLLVVA
ncbi:hypothetical protein KJ567_05665, partial [Candidatus Bipolaricaulota bacterium]|nr:hypothetical protein [Candidatus Bipolaricaulota bacterium]